MSVFLFHQTYCVSRLNLNILFVILIKLRRKHLVIIYCMDSPIAYIWAILNQLNLHSCIPLNWGSNYFELEIIELCNRSILSNYNLLHFAAKLKNIGTVIYRWVYKTKKCIPCKISLGISNISKIWYRDIFWTYLTYVPYNHHNTQYVI